MSTVKLPDESSATFDIFIQWLYVGTIGTFKDDEVRGFAGVKAWILGDMLGCRAFSDHVMHHLLSHYKSRWLQPSVACFAYNKTPGGSRLREWVLDQFVLDTQLKTSANKPSISKWAEEMNKADQWAADLTTKFMVAGDIPQTSPYDQGSRYMHVLPYVKLTG